MFHHGPCSEVSAAVPSQALALGLWVCHFGEQTAELCYLCSSSHGLSWSHHNDEGELHSPLAQLLIHL